MKKLALKNKYSSGLETVGWFDGVKSEDEIEAGSDTRFGIWEGLVFRPHDGVADCGCMHIIQYPRVFSDLF